MEWRFWARTRPAQLNTFGDASGDDCEAIEPLLSLYGDGMASPAEARLLESHLPGCESCRESLAWMQATRRALAVRPVQSPPAALHARIAEAIAASDAAPLRLRPARTFATRPAFAAAASLAAVGLFLGYSLTHPAPPTVAVKPVPPPSVATLPAPPPSVTVAPLKPTTPTVTVRKPKPALMANRDIAPENTAPAPRVPAKNAERPVPTAPPVTAPRPNLKPVTSPPPSLVAAKTPAPVKIKTLKPLSPKPSVLTAKNEVKEPDMQVLAPTVTVQKPMETASATPTEPHTQNVDFISEVRAQIKARAHLPSQPLTGSVSRTVGLSLRGASRVTQAFGEDGKTAHIDGIHSPNY